MRQKEVSKWLKGITIGIGFMGVVFFCLILPVLAGEMKVYEIAKLVGYKHIDYFHSKFKKYVGVSPLEYKKKSDLIER